MSKTIIQKITFKNTTSKTLYDLYMDQKKHSMVTGATAKITNKEGANFSAHDGYIKGKNLQLIKDKLIVQTWHGKDWDKGEPDSVFILNFNPKGKDVILEMIHTNLPDKNADSISKGWKAYYWEPWKKYLLI